MMSLPERCLCGVEMVDFSVRCAAENADAGSLPAGIFFNLKIYVKSIVMAGEKADFVPATIPGPCPESGEVDFCNQCEINFVAHVWSDRGVPIGHILHIGQGSLSFAAHIM